MKRSVLSCAARLCVLLATVTPILAQELTTGTIAGKVVDPTGRGIPGAVIIATSQFGTRTAETDAGGGYILPFLRPATSTLRAAAPGLGNAYRIAGVNITNTGFGGIGAYNINYGSLGTGVTSEFLDEVQIKTGGFEAEYGQALGGIINTIVKSGTNDFKGSVSWYSSPSGLQSSRQLVKLDAGTSNRVNEDVQDFAFSVGGPFVKDKLFYFFAYNP